MRFTTSLFALSFSLACLLATGCTNLDPCTRGTEGCACRVPTSPADTMTCGDNNDPMICAKGTCVRQGSPDSPTVCYDACAYRSDGLCDDGVAGDSKDGLCGYGSDCSDCGARANPCTDPAKPVFCPQTPTSCWPSTVDCSSVRYCPPETTPFGCGVGQAVDCSLTGADRCIVYTCSTAGLAPCIGEKACVAPFIDCNSLTTCNGQTVGCYSGETVTCTNNVASCTSP